MGVLPDRDERRDHGEDHKHHQVDVRHQISEELDDGYLIVHVSKRHARGNQGRKREEMEEEELRRERRDRGLRRGRCGTKVIRVHYIIYFFFPVNSSTEMKKKKIKNMIIKTRRNSEKHLKTYLKNIHTGGRKRKAKIMTVIFQPGQSRLPIHTSFRYLCTAGWAIT